MTGPESSWNQALTGMKRNRYRVVAWPSNPDTLWA